MAHQQVLTCIFMKFLIIISFGKQNGHKNRYPNLELFLWNFFFVGSLLLVAAVISPSKTISKKYF